jgi:hypothetical protein
VINEDVQNEQVEGYDLHPLRLGAVLALAAAVAFFAWLLLKDDDKGSSRKGSAPVAASVKELRRLPGSVGHSVYWAGIRSGYTYELTRTGDGNVYIRYLPTGVSLGDQRPNYLTVGTYPHQNAFGTVSKAARRKGEIVRKLAGGGVAVSNKAIPRSVYIAYPGSDYLIEVYDRSPTRARRLVVSGRVRPIG